MTEPQDFDPPEAPEGGSSMRAKDLKNRVCLFRPTGLGEYPAREAADGEPAKGPNPYVECDVYVLESSGVVEEGTGVRVSWWKAVAQLRDRMGLFTAAKPVEQDDRSVELVALTGAARKVAAQVIAELDPPTAPVEGDGTEPF